MANRWYVALDGEELGPLSDTGLERLIQGGRVDGATMVRNGAAGEWISVELAEEVLAARPSRQRRRSGHSSGASDETRLASGGEKKWAEERPEEWLVGAASGPGAVSDWEVARKPSRKAARSAAVAFNPGGFRACFGCVRRFSAGVRGGRGAYEPLAARLGRAVGRCRRDPGCFVIDRLVRFRSIFVFHGLGAANQSFVERQPGTGRFAAAGRAAPTRSGRSQGQAGGASGAANARRSDQCC